ncbi:MAG: M48 family metalloprotease [Alicyclobacillus mali]|uniref:M48 family metalloprotease n=1 Tax=Alicyclobacillus mali (ex Roth et al. 2021) TaxID=1123961 RepID=UPI0008344F2C|nr:M48 family metalloprotease [Alicyclobacillus mali (ex Roth et al. 2021)]MCL6488234.1 M48 family metalloprotease [Alicyclobacillus mali (ex Roth et al. 2021)]
MRYLWLALNLVVNYILIDAVCSLFLPLPDLWAAIIALAIIALSLSPLAESINRMIYGCRPATREEMEKMRTAWEAVTQAAAAKLPETKRHKYNPQLFVSDEEFPNAFALGTRTVCVTRGMLYGANEDELAGTMAHELGHLWYGDTKIRSVAVTMNMAGNICAWILTLVFIVFDVIMRVFQGVGTVSGGAGVGLGISVVRVFLWLFAMLAKAILWVLNRLISLGMLAVGRKEEFRADAFAREIGFGGGLVSVLHKMEGVDPPTRGAWAALERSHPPIPLRIERLTDAARGNATPGTTLEM